MVAALCLCVQTPATGASATVLVKRSGPEDATAEFNVAPVQRPSRNDAAASGTFTLVDGVADPNSGGLRALTDGRLPAEEDSPEYNFFFRAGGNGGRILLDLKKPLPIASIRSYSWHPGSRAPQKYKVYVADGSNTNLLLEPKRGTDPSQSGWGLLAIVAPSESAEEGGQYAVQITPEPSQTTTPYRYVLFDVEPTQSGDPFAHTFFSEIDVLAADSKDEPLPILAKKPPETFATPDNRYTFILDVAETPELADWARTNIVPMAKEWYPKLVEMFPSEGYTAPQKVTITFRAGMQGVAHTTGTRVTCAGPWFKANLQGEALGAVFHEFVHVVQQYGRASRRSNAPGWLTEGIADYVRWFKYEPDSKGAEITERNLARARYDGNYRISANFLNWVSEQHTKNLVPRLNSAIRQGTYNPEVWKQLTGKTVEELGSDWRAALEKKVAAQKQGS